MSDLVGWEGEGEGEGVNGIACGSGLYWGTLQACYPMQSIASLPHLRYISFGPQDHFFKETSLL